MSFCHKPSKRLFFALFRVQNATFLNSMTHSVGRFQLRYEGEPSAYLTGGIYEKGKQILKYQPGKVQEFPKNNNWKFASFITPHTTKS